MEEIEVRHTAQILDIKFGDTIFNGSYLGRRVTIIMEDYEEVVEKHVTADHVLRVQAHSGDYTIKDTYACTFSEFLSVQKGDCDWENIKCTHDEREGLKKIHIYSQSQSEPERHSKDSVKLLSDIVLGLAELKSNHLCHGNLNLHSIVLCVIEGQVRAKLTQLRQVNKRMKTDYERIGMLINQMFSSGKSYEVEDLRRHINKQQVLYGGDEGVIKRSDWKNFQGKAQDAFEENPITLFKHPFFYTDQQSLAFLVNLYAAVKKCKHSPVFFAHSAGIIFLNHIKLIRKNKWAPLLNECVQTELSNTRTVYVLNDVTDLVKFIRHMSSHIEEKTKEFQDEVGEIPDGHFEYFRSRYPNLLLEAHKILQFFFADLQVVEKFNYKKDFLYAKKQSFS